MFNSALEKEKNNLDMALKEQISKLEKEEEENINSLNN